MLETKSNVKYTSPLSIQYILISDVPNYIDNEFYVKSFNLLRNLPTELVQLENCIQHFEFCFKYKSIKGYELFTLPSEFFSVKEEIAIKNIEVYSKSFGVQSIIRIFIVDDSLKNHTKIAKVLEKMDFSYYTLIGDNNHILKEYPATNLFKKVDDFILIINRDIEKITKKVSNFYTEKGESIDLNFKLNINPNRAFIKENIVPGSIIAWNNYFLLNQIIGNNWLQINNEMGSIVTLPTKRADEIIEQCEKIDSISSIMYNQVGVRPTDPFQPIFPSLIIIQPFHYPQTEKLYGKKFSKQEKSFLAVQNSEQDLTYQHQISEHLVKKISKDGITFMMSKNALRLMYLDNAAFLHSMFTYSPVIRLPQIGKSINLELSHLEKITPKKESTISNIEKFGKKLSRLTLNDSSKNYIKGRNGQIFTISDLPMEWLYLEEYPLCYTHDVCRLPEHNLNSIVNNAIHLQRNLYQIPKDLIKKTLVVHCASKNDTAMHQMFDLIDSQKQNFGFSSVRCSTLNEIKTSIEKYKPELLIFDCHGTSNKSDLSSFLIIDSENNEFLTGDDIVKNKISAPLVFLSACETFPNYGYVRLLSDAFMQAGAFSVTTTFLPIKIVDAATIIIRLLNNLNQQTTNAYHLNWLNFLSHILRSSLIYETINKSRKYLNEEISNEEISEIITKSMRFENRLEALEDLDKLIDQKTSKKVNFKQLDNEWLSYSIIGRADLIYFENWLDSYREINL